MFNIIFVYNNIDIIKTIKFKYNRDRLLLLKFYVLCNTYHLNIEYIQSCTVNSKFNNTKQISHPTEYTK